VRDEELLMRMLAEDARRDRTVRIAASVTLVTLGAAALATIALYPHGPDAQRVTSLVAPFGLPLAMVGVFGVPFFDTGLGLTRRSRLERLSEYYGPGSETGRPWLRSKVEQMWAKEARESRRERGSFWMALGGAAILSAAEAGLLLATGDYRNRVPTSIDVTAIGIGVGLGALGIVTTQGATPTEAGLRDYERAVGRPIVETVDVAFAPVRGGATLNLSARF
jgi:hypothetical protein